MYLDVYGNYAYVTVGINGMDIVEITDDSLFVVGHFDVSGTAWRVKIDGIYAYLTDYQNGLYILDITDKTNPVELSFLSLPSGVYDVDVVGDYAYVSDYISGLRIIDVSDKTNPQETAVYSTGDVVYNADVEGDTVYIASNKKGLRVLDVSDKTAPKEIGYYVSGRTTGNVDFYNGYIYLGEVKVFVLSMYEDTTGIYGDDAYINKDVIVNAVNNKLNIKLNSPGVLKIDLYDIAGMRIKSLSPGYVSSGAYEFNPDINKRGVYLYKLYFNDLIYEGKMLIEK